MISARELRETLAALPGLMKEKRLAMQPSRPGFTPGVRGAAAELNMSPTTYCKIENCKPPNLQTLLKIMNWIEQ